MLSYFVVRQINVTSPATNMLVNPDQKTNKPLKTVPLKSRMKSQRNLFKRRSGRKADMMKAHYLTKRGAMDILAEPLVGNVGLTVKKGMVSILNLPLESNITD